MKKHKFVNGVRCLRNDYFLKFCEKNTYDKHLDALHYLDDWVNEGVESTNGKFVISVFSIFFSMPFLDGFPQIQAEIEKAISSGKLKKGEMWAYKDGPTFADQAMLAFANVIVDFELKDHEDELFNTYTQTVRWLCEEHGQEITERGLTHYRSLAATSNHLRLSGYARKFIDLHESILANKARKEIEEDLDGELKVRAARPRHI